MKARGRFERPRREADRGRGAKHARDLRAALDLRHPVEVPLETVAYLRGALVVPTTAKGASAMLTRHGVRAVISVGSYLSPVQRRFAVAHELGHHEVHPSVSYLGLCTGEDAVSTYGADGREQEADAFASELLMPAELYAPRCDVAKVSWTPIRALSDEYHVSLTSAALRFVDLTDDRVALVSSKAGYVEWVWKNRQFGHFIPKGQQLDPYSIAYDHCRSGTGSEIAETVSAQAWLPELEDADAELVEHSIHQRGLGRVLTLLWIGADATF